MMKTMMKTVWLSNEGIYVDGILISESVKVPHPNYEALQIYWDEETQSVKQEIIQIADMLIEPPEQKDDK